jgi:hypothetical protein
MRHWVLILLLTFLNIGCQQRKSTIDEKQDLGDANFGAQLLESGFLEFADSLKIDTLKSRLINSFYIYDEGNNRFAHIDSEELAEYSFDFFVPRLNEILEKRNFKLDVQVTDDHYELNEVLVNDEVVRLYTKEELESQDFWEAGARNFFKAVNRHLDKKGIGESFYLLYHGNDMGAFLLTKEQYMIIAKRYGGDEEETPYLP